MKKLNVILLIVFIMSCSFLIINAEKTIQQYEKNDTKEKQPKYEKKNDIESFLTYKTVDGKSINLEYKYSKNNTKNYYIDANDIEYVFDAKTKKLVEYKNFKSSDKNKTSNKLSEKDLISAAKHQSQKYFSFANYQLISSTKYDDGSLEILWSRTINNIMTMDRLIVRLTSSGEIESIINPYSNYYEEKEKSLKEKTKLQIDENRATLILKEHIISSASSNNITLDNYVIENSILFIDTDFELYWEIFVLISTSDIDGNKQTNAITYKINAISEEVLVEY